MYGEVFWWLCLCVLEVEFVECFLDCVVGVECVLIERDVLVFCFDVV